MRSAAPPRRVFPMLYLGLPIGAMLALRALSGREGLFLLMLTVMVSDTAQYYSGRAFGRRALAPAISPKKTVEGAIGGLVIGAVLFASVGAWWLPSMPVWLRVGLGLASSRWGLPAICSSRCSSAAPASRTARN